MGASILGAWYEGVDMGVDMESLIEGPWVSILGVSDQVFGIGHPYLRF